MKKFAIFALIVCMCAGMMFFAHAEDAPETRAAQSAATITVVEKTAIPGGTVEVPVVLSNNSGFAYIRVTLEYDSSILTLESVTNSVPELVMAQGNNMFSWDSSSNYTTDGELCILTFNVSEAVEIGSYEITLAVIECYDENTDDVVFNVVNGCISVINYGDVNGDGIVNGKDVIVLRRYLVDEDVEIFAGADANGDGEINGKDVIVIRQYIVGAATLGPNINPDLDFEEPDVDRDPISNDVW